MRLSVRIGLHVGEPIRDEDDYFGTSVVVAKRLCDRAEGGQIIASELVRTADRWPRWLFVPPGWASCR